MCLPHWQKSLLLLTVSTSAAAPSALSQTPGPLHFLKVTAKVNQEMVITSNMPRFHRFRYASVDMPQTPPGISSVCGDLCISLPRCYHDKRIHHLFRSDFYDGYNLSQSLLLSITLTPGTCHVRTFLLNSCSTIHIISQIEIAISMIAILKSLNTQSHLQL